MVANEVRKDWPKIEAVASALLRSTSGCLSYDDAKSVVASLSTDEGDDPIR
jgi:hypothetical protein